MIAINEGYDNEAKTTIPDRATLDRKAEQARARRARKAERRRAVSILNEMNTLKVQKAIGRARRSNTTTTKDGAVRTYRIGQNVASMCSWLLYWEGKGELPGDFVHKANPEWVEETELTESMVRTARRIGREEGLWEEREHLRSDDRLVVKYRLNVVRLLRIANASEIENVQARLGRARNNPSRYEALDRKLEKLEAVRDELGLFDAPPETPEDETRTGRPGPGRTPNGDEEALTSTSATLTTHPCENTRGGLSISHDYRGILQGSTAEDVAYSDHSMEDDAVASDEDDALVAVEDETRENTTSADDNEAFSTERDPDEADEGERGCILERWYAIYDQLGKLMRGEGGVSGERIIGPMTKRHLKGEGVSFERLVLTSRGFVRAEVGDVEVDVAEIVRDLLDAIRDEQGIGDEEGGGRCGPATTAPEATRETIR